MNELSLPDVLSVLRRLRESGVNFQELLGKLEVLADESVSFDERIRVAFQVAGQIALLTPGTIDDQIVAILESAVESDFYAQLVALIRQLASGEQPTPIYGASIGDIGAVDWDKLLQAAMLIIELLKSWRS